MTIGTSIFLIAVGAILKYAVTATVAGVDIETVGVILMVAGVIGLVIGLFLMISARERRGDVVERRVVREDRRDPLP
jgi:beta-lactamase regulating signal transducer with metallopeptidase domain